MATRLFSDLVNRLAPSVPGCPQPVIINYIRDAAIEACARTSAWRYEHATVTLVAGTNSYSFVPESDAEVHTVLTASINGVDIPSRTLEDIHYMYPKYPSSVVAERSMPQYMMIIDPLTFYVAPVPDGDTTYTIEMFVAQKPTRAATGMNEAVMDDLETVIMHGALQHLLVLPERTWTDRELASYHAKQYAFKSAERRARANVGSGRAPLNVRMNAWA